MGGFFPPNVPSWATFNATEPWLPPVPLDSLPAFRAFQNTLEERYIYRRHIQP